MRGLDTGRGLVQEVLAPCGHFRMAACQRLAGLFQCPLRNLAGACQRRQAAARLPQHLGLDTALALLSAPVLAETAVVVVTPQATTETQQAADTAVGAVVGAAIGGAAASVEPAPEVQTWIVENPAEDVVLEGELAVGVVVPETVVVREVPEQEYSYARINGRDVLIGTDRQVVYIY